MKNKILSNFKNRGLLLPLPYLKTVNKKFKKSFDANMKMGLKAKQSKMFAGYIPF